MVYLFFLFFIQNIDCGYSLEPPCGGVPTINVLSKYINYIKKFPTKFSIFKAEKKFLYIVWASFRNVLVDRPN